MSTDTGDPENEGEDDGTTKINVRVPTALIAARDRCRPWRRDTIRGAT